MLKHGTIKKQDEEDSKPFRYRDGSFPMQQRRADAALFG